MKKIDKIKKDIMNDADNVEFSKKGWEPVFMANPEAKIVIIGPAPGKKTQEREIALKDKSGDQLRKWLAMSDEFFYKSKQIAVLPLDFYFPGKGKVGDLPPRKGFADKWHPKLLSEMPQVKLIILMGNYAQKYYLKSQVKKNLTQTVFAYEEYLPEYFPIVHPSPLNFRWFAKNPSFELEVVPALQKAVSKALS